jgi:DNA-binding winged helix-turn-helix (wHTH) protein
MYTIIENRKKGIKLDLRSGVVSYNTSSDKKMQTRLGTKERELLSFLIKNIGRIVSKEDILQHVWSNKIVCENSASVALSNIRKLLRKADEDCACLVSISGSGYIFNPAKSGFSLRKHEELDLSIT